MTMRVFIPYLLGSEHRSIVYQYENIVTRCDGAPFQFTCFSLPSPRPTSRPFLDVVEVPRSNTPVKRYRMLRHSFRSYDVLHTGGGPVLRYFLSRGTYLRNPDVRHVHTLHVDVDEEESRTRRFKQRMVSMADTVVAVSEHTARTAARHLGVRPDVIHNGIDTGYFRPDREPPGLFDGLGVEPPVFLFVGAFEARKRPNDVLDVARAVPEATFLLRGSGPLEETIRAAASDLDNVRLPDRVSKSTLARMYAAADGFLFPSTKEGCPTVVLEALASGTPVVGYEATSMPELIADGETGYLCDVGDTDALADAVRELCDPTRSKRLGERARAYAYDHHRFELVADQYRKLYEPGGTYP